MPTTETLLLPVDTERKALENERVQALQADGWVVTEAYKLPPLWPDYSNKELPTEEQFIVELESPQMEGRPEHGSGVEKVCYEASDSR